MTWPEVRIGSQSRRAIIALYLDPEDAEDLAQQFPPPDLAYDELMTAASEARMRLGEAEPDRNGKPLPGEVENAYDRRHPYRMGVLILRPPSKRP